MGARLALVDDTSRPAFGGEAATGLADVDVVAIGELVGGESAALVERADDDLAVLLFTSGTAGLPRAAMLTHGNLRANIDQMRAGASDAGDTTAGPPTADDVALGVIPLFHIFGLNAVLGLALDGGGLGGAGRAVRSRRRARAPRRAQDHGGVRGPHHVAGVGGPPIHGCRRRQPHGEREARRIGGGAARS